MSSATTTAIPLAPRSQQQGANAANLFPVNNNVAAAPPSTVPTQTSTSSAPNNLVPSNATAPAINQPSLLPTYTNLSPTWREKFTNACSLANGLGTFALLAAVIFGIGAWVGMKIQINQGGKSMELAIWTACADHEAIQDSTLCRSIMAKDFSELATRQIEVESKEMTVVVKRGLEDPADQLSAGKGGSSYYAESRLSKLVASLSDTDKNLVIPNSDPYDYRSDHTIDPAIRATIFPLVSLLSKPIRWVFDSIESVLLIIVYCIHKVLSWMTSIFIFMVQALIYSWVEKIVQGILAGLDQAIWGVMPSWMPYLLASNIASWFGLSALRSFWYGTSYLNSLKWIFIVRLGMWLIVQVAKLSFKAWTAWKDSVAQRQMQQDIRSQPYWLRMLGNRSLG